MYRTLWIQLRDVSRTWAEALILPKFGKVAVISGQAIPPKFYIVQKKAFIGHGIVDIILSREYLGVYVGK